MFGSLGMPEVLVIMVLVLLLFGPKRLPQIGRTLGRGLREFRQATSELKRTVETEMASVDVEPERPAPAAAIAPAAAKHTVERSDSPATPAASPQEPVEAGDAADAVKAGELDARDAIAEAESATDGSEE